MFDRRRPTSQDDGRIVEDADVGSQPSRCGSSCMIGVDCGSGAGAPNVADVEEGTWAVEALMATCPIRSRGRGESPRLHHP
jgi:hypothetical protein